MEQQTETKVLYKACGPVIQARWVVRREFSSTDGSVGSCSSSCIAEFIGPDAEADAREYAAMKNTSQAIKAEG